MQAQTENLLRINLITFASKYQAYYTLLKLRRKTSRPKMWLLSHHKLDLDTPEDSSSLSRTSVLPTKLKIFQRFFERFLRKIVTVNNDDIKFKYNFQQFMRKIS